MEMPKFVKTVMESRFISIEDDICEAISSECIDAHFFVFPVNPGTKIETHTHDNGTHFVFVRYGKLKYTLGDESRIVGQGDFIIILPNEPHSFESVDDNPASVIAFDIPLKIND